MLGLSFGMGIELNSDTEAQSQITYLATGTNTLPETASEGAVAATLSIIGDDYVAPAIFTITSDPSGLFEITGNELRVASGASFDYEATPSYALTIEGVDAAPNTYSKTVYVAISNVNEAPTDIALDATTISEEAEIGDVIAIISSSGDPDAGATATYSIVSDPDNKFTVVGDELRVNGTMTGSADHNVTIRVSDGGLTYDETFTIDVTGTASGITGPFMVAPEGQSNAVSGRFFDEQADFPTGVLVYNQAGSFVQATTPLPVDNFSGMVWIVQFAIEFMRQNPGAILILVPTGEGNTGFESGSGPWAAGNSLYNESISRINAALAAYPTAVFGGWLYDQFEREILSDYNTTFAAQLDASISGRRAAVTGADATTPFVVGGASLQFVNDSGVATEIIRQAIYDVLENTPSRVSYTAKAEADDLILIDAYHYNAPSMRKRGSRFYDAFMSARDDGGSVAIQPHTPNAIAELVVLAMTTTIVVSWHPPFDGDDAITGYLIERQEAGGGFSTLTTVVNTDRTFKFVDTTVTQDVEYGYRVTVVNSTGSSAVSNIALGTATASFELFTFDSDVAHHIDPKYGQADLFGAAEIRGFGSFSPYDDPTLGRVFSFDKGDEWGRLQVSNGVSFSGSSYTKIAMLYATAATSEQGIISYYDPWNGSLRHIFWLPNGQLRAGHGNNQTNYVNYSTILTLNTWHQVAVTYDAAATTMRLWIDGVMVAENTSVPVPSAWKASFAINAHYIYDSGESSGKAPKGRYGAVTLIDRALSSTELAEHMSTVS